MVVGQHEPDRSGGRAADGSIPARPYGTSGGADTGFPASRTRLTPDAGGAAFVASPAMNTHTIPSPLHVLIAGGGVAALEAMMALRALAGDRVEITLLAPEREFHYRPWPSPSRSRSPTRGTSSWPGSPATSAHELVTGALAAVEPGEHRVVTRAGERIVYDALVIACGTRMRPAFDGAITIDDRNLGGDAARARAGHRGGLHARDRVRRARAGVLAAAALRARAA